jgi:hypothetical protein
MRITDAEYDTIQDALSQAAMSLRESAKTPDLVDWMAKNFTDRAHAMSELADTLLGRYEDNDDD